MSVHLAAALFVALVGCLAPPVPPPTASPAATAPPATPTQAPPSPSPTVEPTASPSPTSASTFAPSPGPTESATASATLPAEGIVVGETRIAAHLDALADIAAQHGGTRAAGESGYDASADYVADHLETMGYEVNRHRVDFTYFEETAPVSLAIGDQSWSGPEWLKAMIYSTSGDVSAPIELVPTSFLPGSLGACDPDRWTDFAPGRIALVQASPCARRDQVVLAQQAGAVAFIGLLPLPAGQTLRPTLLDPSGIDIPVVGVSTDVGDALVLFDDGEEATLRVKTELSPATADNVFGELAGSSDEVVMLGGHLDSVIDGPGLNDNGSGVATLLAIAESAAAQPDRQRGIRFAFWTAEEFGTLGSVAYVDSLSAAEIDRIDAYLNLDMVGSPNAGRYVYDDDFAAAGSGQISRSIRHAFEALGAPALPILSGGSDHLAFADAGIRTGGVFSGNGPLTPEEAALFGGEAGVLADACYHLPCDDRSNVDTGTALLFGQAIAAALEDLAF